MQAHQVKLGEDGRIVIPAAYRKVLKLAPGETLMVQLSEGELHIFSQSSLLKQAQQTIRQATKGRSLVKELKLLRKEED